MTSLNLVMNGRPLGRLEGQGHRVRLRYDAGLDASPKLTATGHPRDGSCMTEGFGVATATPPSSVAYRSDTPADRFMRRLLGVRQLQVRPSAEAHRAFRVSVAVSAVRCIVTYVLVPVLVPILSLAGWVAAPVGIALCVFAVVNGVISLKRFWSTDHPRRWMYTGFMFIVFTILAVALVSDLSRLGGLA